MRPHGNSIDRGDRTRTCDLKVPNFARYQLCYTPDMLIIHATRAEVNSNAISVELPV